MIITAPTGLYATILPTDASDSTSVTFTISNNSPPRTNLLFPKIPTGVLFRQKELQPIDPIQRRKTVGELIFAISDGNRSVPGNNSKQFEIGQILEFSDIELQALEPMLVGKITETRHDINLLDFKALGLTEDEIGVISERSTIAQSILADKLNGIRRTRSDAEKRIIVNQQVLNETNKTISALEVTKQEVSDTSNIDDIIDKLLETRQIAQAAIDSDTSIANAAAAEAVVIQDQLVSLTAIVK